ncbi:hypothetical protein WBP07_11075 [Novosphingobium sp. BL-8A]|uniref:hypothetical protein n=1 Tax=Novosphingobium sp. BL-8A TaxID=3127639 RepID=UPI00375794B9
MRRSYLLFLSALCMAAPIGAAAPSHDAWIFLGGRNLASGTERETMTVISDRPFRQLQLCVFNTPLQLGTVSIHFDEGQPQDVTVDQRIARGECSQTIDLGHAPRHVRSVDLAYHSVSRFRRPPMVRIVGR